MSLKLYGTIEPTAVDERSFTGVASMDKLEDRVDQYSHRLYRRDKRNSLVLNLPINDDLEVQFWVLGIPGVDLDRGPAVIKVKESTTADWMIITHHL